MAKNKNKNKSANTPKDGLENQPKFQTVGDWFIAQTTEGEIRIKLSVKTKVFRAISELEELAQLFALLDGIGDTRTIKILDELDFQDTSDVVEGFFAAFEAKHKKTPGE